MSVAFQTTDKCLTNFKIYVASKESFTNPQQCLFILLSQYGKQKVLGYWMHLPHCVAFWKYLHWF